MKNPTPKVITDTLTVLQTDRQVLADRLAAIDHLIEALVRAYEITDTGKTPRKLTAKPKGEAAAADNGEAAERRTTLLTLIAKSEIGLSLGELRKATAKMDGKDRSNALQALKLAGKITRAGNAWKAA